MLSSSQCHLHVQSVTMPTLRAPLVLLLLLQVVLKEGHLSQALQTPLQTIDKVQQVKAEVPDRPKEQDVNSKSLENEEIIPRVNVPGLGTAKGRTLTSFERRQFYAFMSIPYAQPIEQSQRFTYSELWSGPWTDTDEEGDYEAFYLRARCPQISLILNVTAGREDCLHLSIYTPVLPEDLPDEEYLPVMVWFHGGGYMSGDANLYVPTKLMDGGVMVVVVQYRLGSFGFLAGNTPEAPGNMGLMDQIISLRWVQEYIEAFGGDRDKVTVFGQSAGGASSSWMQLSPLTNSSAPANNGRQLLHRVIPQSGSALELWTIDSDPEAGFQLTAETLDCWDETDGKIEIEDKPDIIDCMRDKSTDEVNRAAIKIYKDDRGAGGLGFKALCPVVQAELAYNNSDIEIVIPKQPQDILSNAEFLQIPMMAGTVRDEGSLVVGLSYDGFMIPNNHTIEDTDFIKYDVLSTILGAFGLEDKNGAVRNSMKVAYLPNAVMGDWNSMVGGLIDMSGVMFLKSGLWEVANYVNRATPDVDIFFYSWEFESDDSLFPWIFISDIHIPVPGGISHADELLYLFYLPSDQDLRQRNMSRKMTKLWTNFAKYGDPTPDNIMDPSDDWRDEVSKWEKYTNEDYNYMLIRDDFVMQQDFTKRWNYHRDLNTFSSTAVPEVVTVDPESVVPRDEYDDQVHTTEQFKIATGVLGGVVGLALVASVAFVVFKTQMNKRNRIV